MMEARPAADWAVERLTGPQDLEGVLAVDEASFHRPWTREMYAAELARPDVCRLFVLRGAAWPVAGYCAAWFVADELHINNLAVRPECRRRGGARALLEQVLAEARAAGLRRATLEVRRSNAAARALYEGIGFRVAGIRRDYYTEPIEDALILWRDDLQAAGLA